MMHYPWHIPEAAAVPSATGGEPERQDAASPASPHVAPAQAAPEAPETLVPAQDSPTTLAEQYGHSGEWRVVCVANFDTFAAELSAAKPADEDAAVSVVLAYWQPPTRLVRVPPEWIG